MVVFFYIFVDNNIIIKNYNNLDIDFLIYYIRYINFFYDNLIFLVMFDFIRIIILII